MFKDTIKVVNGMMEDSNEIIHLFDTSNNHALILQTEQGVLAIKFYLDADIVDIEDESMDTEDGSIESFSDILCNNKLAVGISHMDMNSVIVFNEDGDLDENFLGIPFEYEYSYTIDNEYYLDELLENQDIDEAVADEIRLLSVF